MGGEREAGRGGAGRGGAGRGGAWCGVVWCGEVCCGVVVVLSWCPCPWSFLLRMIGVLQRARAERSMIERRVGQHMECVVFAPFSKWVRSNGYFW